VFSGQEAIIFHRSQVGYKLTLLIATFYNFFGCFIIVLLFTEWHFIVTTRLPYCETTWWTVQFTTFSYGRNVQYLFCSQIQKL